jgi:hypothetical protein
MQDIKSDFYAIEVVQCQMLKQKPQIEGTVFCLKASDIVARHPTNSASHLWRSKRSEETSAHLFQAVYETCVCCPKQEKIQKEKQGRKQTKYTDPNARQTRCQETLCMTHKQESILLVTTCCERARHKTGLCTGHRRDYRNARCGLAPNQDAV